MTLLSAPSKPRGVSQDVVRSEKLQPWHYERLAVVYVRQSTPQQVLAHQESTRLQYGLDTPVGEHVDEDQLIRFLRLFLRRGQRSHPWLGKCLLGQQHREDQHAPQRGELLAYRPVMIRGASHCLLRARGQLARIEVVGAGLAIRFLLATAPQS